MAVKNGLPTPLLYSLMALSGMSASPTVLAAGGTDLFLEEVIITARKRVEGLQDTPISVSAFTGESLDYRGVSNIGQIAEFTPNLTFQNNPSFGGSSNSAAVYMRGIGQKEFLPTTEPGVGIYVDGVYIARSVGAILDLVDVERVEVLRGPQGTLFGRNTIGGAISLTTKRPSHEFGGKVEVKAGSDSRQDIKATINMPITDTLQSNVSIASFNQDGYVEREDGIDLGDDDTFTARVALAWQASDDVEVHFSADTTRDRENGAALTLIGINPGVAGPNTPAFATIYNASATHQQIGVPAPCAIGGVTTPGLPPIANCYDNQQYVKGSNFNAGTAPAFSDSDLDTATLNVEWALSDNLELRSITGVRSLESEFSRDGDHSPLLIQQYYDDFEQDQFSQEFQLLGSTADDAVEWILGAYYFKEDGNSINLLDFVVSSFRSGGKFENEATALFGQASWHVNDKLTATLGLRYTDESKKFLPDQVVFSNALSDSVGTLTPFATDLAAALGASPNPADQAAAGLLGAFATPFLAPGARVLPYLEREISVEETTPMLNIAYDVDDSLMVFATYSEGFKSGGFSQRVFPPIVAGFTAPAGTPDIELIPTFEPEYVKAYELGFKYNSYDNRYKINGAVFYTDYTDLQVQVFESVAPVTKNAGSATIEGAELEIQAVPVDGWLLELAVGYLNAGYDEISQTQTLVNPSNDLERISEWTYSGSVSKEFSLGDAGVLIPRIDFSYHSEMFHDTLNTPEIAQDDYTIVNANLAWHSVDEEWRATLGVKNLTDKEYLISGIAGDAFQTYEGLYDRGQEWYLSVAYSF